MHRFLANSAAGATLVAAMVLQAGCPDVSSFPGTEDFPRLSQSMLPPDFGDQEVHLGAGLITGVGPEQPIAFPHHKHIVELGMQCEYCHSSARKSIHGGVPETRVCAGCHWQVKADHPEIAKILSFGEGCGFEGAGGLNANCEPIPWKKVHDIPDFVHFSHKRHVQGGVECTECHGQVELQGQPTTWTKSDAMGNPILDDDGHLVKMEGVRYPMVRETTMQMGWCLDCHASHPSIDKNYGDKADLRRAELKDCWTCHK